MAVALGIAAAVAVPSLAVAKDGDIRRSGTCGASATSKITLSDEDGRIEVEFEVDQNRNGVPWRVVITRNGSRVFAGLRTTRAPSGSFTVRRVLGNAAGADVIRATATNTRSGAVCRASATWR
jgi:2-methylaconitate cis-trans-isomerase PrpF